MNNTLIYGLIFGLILAPGFIGIELRFFSFLVRLFKLNLKLNRPTEVLALLISLLILLPSSINVVALTPSVYGLLIIISSCIIILGLWQMKKWVLYAFLAFSFLPLVGLIIGSPYEGISDLFHSNNIWLNVASAVSQVLILLIYYLFVYHPNKQLFK